MTTKLHVLLIALLLVISNVFSLSSAQAGQKDTLDARQQAIIPIAAFTASGELATLKPALQEGLEAGLTVSEIKETLVHLYAYVGFPRSLNALGTFMMLLDERAQQGIQDKAGKDASPVDTSRPLLERGTQIQTQVVGRPVAGKLFTFSPLVDRLLKEHLFGDLFERDNLSFTSREIATLAALANLDGVSPQLKAHFGISMNVGLTEAQLNTLLAVMEAKVGRYQADRAAKVLAQALGKNKAVAKARPITVTHTSAKPPITGPKNWFTGSVTITKPFKADAPSHFSGAEINFDAGSRTAWHSHDLGQLLIVTSGVGRVQRWGGPVQEIRKGDVVWISPYQKHWHGASPKSPMTHIAILETGSAPATEWMEHVSNTQYATKPE